MYGHHVHEAVLARGCRVTGATVHVVDDEYDHGPILAQRACEVRDDDTPETLAARVQAVERELVPEVVRKIAMGAPPRVRSR
jgi:folate-dependent phosphoribosylglycinamide formyltransferase PurN